MPGQMAMFTSNVLLFIAKPGILTLKENGDTPQYANNPRMWRWRDMRRNWSGVLRRSRIFTPTKAIGGIAVIVSIRDLEVLQMRFAAEHPAERDAFEAGPLSTR